MDKELKEKFFKQFETKLRRIAEGKTEPSAMATGQWMFGYIPQFIEDVFNVGKEAGELEGRLQGYDKGVEDEVERQKKALDELSKLN